MSIKNRQAVTDSRETTDTTTPPRGADGVDLPADLPPLLQRLYASRGVRSAQELERGVKGMLPWSQLTGVEKAVEMLYGAFQQGLHIVVVGDFDADGATSTALSVLALRGWATATSRTWCQTVLKMATA